MYFFKQHNLALWVKSVIVTKRLSSDLAQISKPQLQQHEEHFFFSFFLFLPGPEMMRNAVAQQSCRYLTPLLSGAGEKPIHFQLLYLLTVYPVSKHRGGERKVSSPIRTLPVLVEHWGFNYLGWLWHEEAKTAQQQRSRADVDPRNNLLLSFPASERIPSCSGLSWIPKSLCAH